MRAVIREFTPYSEETISCGAPVFFLNGLLGHFAAFKDHIGFYPTPSGMLEFKHELSRYKHGEVSGQFPVKEPLPIDLIGKIMRFWVKEYKKKGER